MSAISQKGTVAYVIPILVGITYVVRLKLSSVNLPSQVAIHFSLQGTPNGWMSKPAFIIFSVGMLAMTIIGGFLIIHYVMLPQNSFSTPMFIFGVTLGLLVGSFSSIIAIANNGKAFSIVPVISWAFAVGAATWLIARL
jgi:hypothetical protein